MIDERVVCDPPNSYARYLLKPRSIHIRVANLAGDNRQLAG
ncbi:hypothetical protein CP97_14820 [Aurantiacibacter atlanticus]|uniref:Uncharacterized protein n=1 Tax=Aurantiacibacter atlanticus TaxID=1648404 RepID=A0A168M314_9SPHN|nr:hypothetical protein CP97_14820 [Aurantiacibacter atlanticus]